MSPCDAKKTEEVNPTFILALCVGTLSRNMGHCSVLNIAELKGLRLGFECAQKNGICGPGYWRGEVLLVSLHGDSMQRETN